MHALQQHILSQAIHNASLRYADLKPDGVDGNLFTYHLKAILKQGWLEKRSDGQYALTLSGRRYVDGLSLETLIPRAQPRIVTLLIIENEFNEFVWLQRARQPLLDQIGFPYGKIHLGESIDEAAVRELREKTGLVAELSHRGDGYITIYESNEPVSQIMFHLFYGHHNKTSLLSKSSSGPVFWAGEWEIDQRFMLSCRDYSTH